MTSIKRSRLLNLLSLFFFAMAVVNLGRGWQANRNEMLLVKWDPSLSMAALLVASLVWAAVFLVAGWGLWRRRGWARRLAMGVPAVYGAYSAGLVLAFTRNPYARGRWALIALGWVVIELVICWLLTRVRFKVHFKVR